MAAAYSREKVDGVGGGGSSFFLSSPYNVSQVPFHPGVIEVSEISRVGRPSFTTNSKNIFEQLSMLRELIINLYRLIFP